VAERYDALIKKIIICNINIIIDYNLLFNYNNSINNTDEFIHLLILYQTF